MATITRTWAGPFADRYQYDFVTCNYKKGWAQLDTRQDASYYGNWINPTTRELLSYCEGDLTHTVCENDTDFIQAVRGCVNWHKDNDYFIGIDGMCSDTIIEAFSRLGLAELLH